jgi:hypothetical protein
MISCTRHDIQHYDIHHNDTQHKQHLADTTLCRTTIYIACHYAECRDLFIVMQHVIMMSVVMLNVVAPSCTPCPKNDLKMIVGTFSNANPNPSQDITTAAFLFPVLCCFKIAFCVFMAVSWSVCTLASIIA